MPRTTPVLPDPGSDQGSSWTPLATLTRAAEVVRYLRQNPEALTLLRRMDPKDNAYPTHRRPATKSKGGKKPVEYLGVELYVDLQASLASANSHLRSVSPDATLEQKNEALHTAAAMVLPFLIPLQRLINY